jgi:hypothetical protein
MQQPSCLGWFKEKSHMSDEIQRGGKRTRKIPAPAKSALPMDQQTLASEAPPVTSGSLPIFDFSVHAVWW